MQDAAARGMGIAVTAREAPARRAIVAEQGALTFGELSAQANQLGAALGPAAHLHQLAPAARRCGIHRRELRCARARGGERRGPRRRRARQHHAVHVGHCPESDIMLCTGPLYHAAPLAFNLVAPLAAGIGTVLMDRWDAERALALIERHRVTHAHMVATMFHRMLALPDAVKARHDLSSLRVVPHGAAPAPGPEEWLARPGSVGRPADPGNLEVRDDEGRAVPSGTVGTIWFRAPAVGRFGYFGGSAKTQSSYDGDWFTMRDMGYQDDEGYVFLTGRTSELTISGGVNIYPAEIDAVLLMHPAVADAAAVGVPNEEFGEEVRAVVRTKPGFEPSDALARELMEHCRARLAHFKCPRAIDFDASLPRSEAGKVQRRAIRERYWQGLGRQI